MKYSVRIAWSLKKTEDTQFEVTPEQAVLFKNAIHEPRLYVRQMIREGKILPPMPGMEVDMIGLINPVEDLR